MTQTTTLTAGIDTSKHKLDIALHGASTRWRVDNSSTGWRHLVAEFKKLNVAKVGVEATGGYERGVVIQLRAAGVTALVLQPIQVKAYARMHLRRARTTRSMPRSSPPAQR